MKTKYSFLLLFAFLLSISKLNANVLKVSSLNDAGAGTLRNQIVAAAVGDTVLIDVIGTINLTSPIFLNTGKNVTVIGPYPIHCTINTSGVPSATAFDVDATATLVLKGVKFLGGAGVNGYVLVNGTCAFYDCVFEGHNGTANGAAMNVGFAGTANVYNCSFIQNVVTSTTGGGAIYNNNNLNLVNCTFFENSSKAGGAIYNSNGDINILNCTFYRDEATLGIGSGNIIFSNGGTISLQNTIAVHNGGPMSECFASVGGTVWTSHSGNIIRRNSGGFLSAIAGDIFNSTFGPVDPLFRVGGLLTDGYGLKYLPLQTSSIAIDLGNPGVVLTTPLTDCRRAPRIISGIINLLPDAGAVEYTPHTVKIAAAFVTEWTNMNLSARPGPRYMDFDLPGPTNIPLASTQSITDYGRDRIIDGYTTPGCAIAGPRDPLVAGNYITPADLYVTIIANTSTALEFEGLDSLSWIAGLHIDNGSAQIGVFTLDTKIHFYGNHIICSAGNGQTGLLLTGSSGVTKVGGKYVHECNVISGQNNSSSDASGIYITDNSSGFISGNFIGTNFLASTAISNKYGILLNSASNIHIGGKRFDYTRNIISTNTAANIKLAPGSNAFIKGNLLGVDITGDATISATPIGIEALANTAGIIGGTAAGDGNIIGGCDNAAISIISANNFEVYGNYIGMSPNLGFANIGNNLGISIQNNGTFTHKIGNGTIGARNYINGNANNGIAINNSKGNEIIGNYIGVKPNNTPMGNSAWGIQVIGSGSENNKIQNNVISNNSIDGIIFDTGAGLNNIVDGNKIGTDTLGMVAMGNLARGIHVLNQGANLQIINNTISANGQSGIHVENGLNTIQINNNTIGLNNTQSGVLSNAAGVSALNSQSLNLNGNVISGNLGDGIRLETTSNVSIKGNYIGTTAGNIDFGNTQNGIYFLNSLGATVGGSVPASQNSIAYNSEGIFVEKRSNFVQIDGNHIFLNDGRGINLDNATPLPNDVNDVDISGNLATNHGNDGQNKPTNIIATYCAGTTTVNGQVDIASLLSTYIIHVYKVNTGNIDASGAGEGDSLLTTITISPVANPIVFSSSTLSTLNPGDVLSLTCTEVTGSGPHTSEFSDTVMVKSGVTASTSLISNVSCNAGSNGSATVSASSTGPFTFQWYNASTGLPLTGGTNDTINTLTAGSYYCVVVDLGLSCTINSDTVTVTEPSAILPNVSVTNETCIGYNNGTLTAAPTGGTGPYDFMWQNSVAVTVDTDTDSLSSHPINLPADTYAVTITDFNGCIATGSQTVNAATNTVTSNFNVLGSACLGTAMNFTDLSTGVPGVTGWNWNFGDGSGTSTLQNPNYIYSSAGTFSAQLIASNGSCSDTITLIVTVDNPGTVNAGSDVSVCQTTTLVALSGNETGTTSTSWSSLGTGVFTPSTTVLNPSYAYSASEASVGVATLVLSGFNGSCIARDTLVITINQMPTANAGTDLSVCANTTATLTGTVTNATSQLWTSSSSGTFGSPTATNTTYLSSLSSGTDTILFTTGTNGSCPSANDTLIITILPSPTATISAISPGTWCVGDPAAGIEVTFTGTGPWEFTMDNGSGTTPTTTAIASPYILTGITSTTTWTVNYVTDNANGCTTTPVSGSATVTILTGNDPTFSYSNDSLCSNSAIISPTAATTGGTYGVVGGGSGLTINATTGDIDPTSSTAGTYQVYHEFTTPCNTSDTVTIFIISAPTVLVTPTYEACYGDTVNFTAVPFGGTWSGVSSGLNPTTGELVTWTLIPGSTYTINYTYTDAGTGCSANDTNNINILAPPSVSFSGLASSYCTSDGPVVLTGSPSGGIFFLNGVAQTASTFNYDPTTPGVDSISYAYISPTTGCANFTFQVTTVSSSPASPILSATAPYLYCESNPQVILVSNPASTVNWYTDAALSTLLTTGSSVSSSVFPGGTGTIYVVNSMGTSCNSAPTSFTYTNYTASSTVNMGGPYTTCPGVPVTLNMSITGSGFIYAWLNNSTINDTTALNPTVTPLTTTTYYVMLSPSTLPTCTVYDSVTVNVGTCDLTTITNAFTPDGDGINETWTINGIEAYPENRVTIFNRWGDKLWQTNNYDNLSNAWDGFYNGIKVAVGTYYYVIEVPSQSLQKSGWIQVNY